MTFLSLTQPPIFLQRGRFAMARMIVANTQDQYQYMVCCVLGLPNTTAVSHRQTLVGMWLSKTIHTYTVTYNSLSKQK